MLGHRQIATLAEAAAEVSPMSIEVAQMEAVERLGVAIHRINRMTELLRLIDRRDSEWNLFNCVSGGYIRQELKQILEA